MYGELEQRNRERVENRVEKQRKTERGKKNKSRNIKKLVDSKVKSRASIIKINLTVLLPLSDFLAL